MPKRKISLSSSSSSSQNIVSSEDLVNSNKRSNSSSISSQSMLSSNDMSSPFPGPDLPIGAKSNSSNSRKIHAAIVGNRLLYGRAKPQTTRKLVIKNTRTKEPDSTSPSSSSQSNSAEKYYEETMDKLENTLFAILCPGLIEGVDQSETSPYSRHISQEELYRGVENLCRYNKSRQLAEVCMSTIETYAKMLPDVLQPYADKVISDISLSRASSSSVTRYYPFLKALVDLWKSWSLKIILVRNIFFYLDRSYLLPAQNKQKPIWDTGVTWFSKLILQNSNFKPLLFDGVSKIINSFRSSKETQLEIVEDISGMLLSFKSDRPELEKAIIESAKEFCNNQLKFNPEKIESFIEIMLAQESIERTLANKLKCSDDFISKMTMNIKELLLKSHHQQVFTNIGVLVENSSTKLFQELYTVSNQLGLQAELLSAFKSYVIEHGSLILRDSANTNVRKGGSAFITNLLEYYQSCTIIVDKGTDKGVSSFTKSTNSRNTIPASKIDGDYENTFRLAFAEFLNKDRSGIVAESLAKYADELLRSGIKTCSEKELDDKLDNLILIFRCVQGKDVFEAFYKKDFAKRLLQSKTAGLDFEKSMISKFKQECGPTFTSRLETMIKDMELSKTYATEFRKASSSKAVTFTANILTQGHWPAFPETKLLLPPNLAEYEKDFEKYYLTGKDGRKLNWQRGLGHCVVRANFPKGGKELNINLIQTVVLLQFNTFQNGKLIDSHLSYADIKQSTQIDDDANLKRTLQSLAHGRYKVLTKDPPTRDINESDVFSVNLDFEDNSFRIKISQISSNEATPRESKKTHQEVHRDRQMEIQAAIIRLMKARKKLKHVELVQQTIDQIKNRGVPDVQDIKKNIEKLLEREYLERVDNTDTYIYV